MALGPSHLRPNLSAIPRLTFVYPFLGEPGARSVEDVEDATFLSIAAVAVTILPTLAMFAALSICSALAVAVAPSLGRVLKLATLGGRRRGVLCAGGHKLLEFAAVEPHAAAGWAHVELHTSAVHGLHGAVIVGA